MVKKKSNNYANPSPYHNLRDLEQPDDTTITPVCYKIVQPQNPRVRNLWASKTKMSALAAQAAAAWPFLAWAWIIALALASAPLAALSLPLLTFALYLRTILPSNDLYTKVLLIIYKRLFFKRTVPTARHNMVPALMKKKDTLSLRPIFYALKIRVPDFFEEEFKADNISYAAQIGQTLEENLHKLPFTLRKDEFAPGEDPVEYAMSFVRDVYPDVHQVWAEKTTDNALVQLCFYGLGAHRLKCVTRADPKNPKAQKKYWTVECNDLSQLPVREGFGHYGGDAYFNYSTWRIEFIEVQTPIQHPWDPHSTLHYPGDPKWDYVKFVFRSTLFTLVTLVDHLYGLHMTIGNNVVIATRQQLSPDHPIRRFLTPFQFQTIGVNDNARNNLINPNSMGPRCFALTDVGSQMAWSAAPQIWQRGQGWSQGDSYEDFLEFLDRERFIEGKRKEFGGLTQYYAQSLDYWKLMKTFVESYLRVYYPEPRMLAKDAEAVYFVLQSAQLLGYGGIRSIVTPPLPRAGTAEPPQINPDQLWELTVLLVTKYCEEVTQGHEQVGTVPVYAQDSSFTAFSWYDGKLIGTKQAAVNAAVLMAFTSMPMPRLMNETGSDGDWSFLFPQPKSGVPRAKAVDAWVVFQRGLTKLSADCDAWNDEWVGSAGFHDKKAQWPASTPYKYGVWTVNPRYLETSVSV